MLTNFLDKMMPPSLICAECGESAAPLDWQCRVCGGPLRFDFLPAFSPDSIRQADWSLWRYAAMLPVEKRFSLGEGMTPLIETSLDGQPFFAKLEYLNPTGSYKDRGSTTMMNHMVAQGVTTVVEDSSGNAGASVAAFSSLGGIHARIFVPATAAPPKKALIASFGAELVEIPGPQYAKTAACLEAAKTTPYASHAWSPYFILGQMTAAWEVWEQLGQRAPDAIACPVGHGGLFLGFARGFKALLEAGLIEKMPRLFAVQSEGCDPIVRAWENDAENTAPITPTPTVADGIIVDVPVRAKEVLLAIRESGGAALRVGNEAILAAKKKLTAQGLVIEPTSAVPAAAFAKISAEIGSAALLVIAFTGSGLKGLAAS